LGNAAPRSAGRSSSHSSQQAPPPAIPHVTSSYVYFGPGTRFMRFASFGYWSAVITSWCTNVIHRVPDALELTHRRTAAMTVALDDQPPRHSLLIPS
jgi:hypothetical protein